MEAPVLNAANQKVGTTNLDDAIFGGAVNEALLWEVVRMQLACKRQGTSAVKTRAEVAGSGKKPWKQKGSGRARVGERRNSAWRGGGINFGPHPRDYAYSMPKKKKRAALHAALAAKFKDGELLLVDSLGLTEIKTKALVEVLGKLEATNSLIIIGDANEIIERSAKNLPKVKVLRVAGLNVYDILRFDKLIFVGDALDKFIGGL